MTGRHRPSACAVLAFEHAEQPPAHADSQQTPSMQLPLPHSREMVHAAPCGLIVVQIVPAQKLPAVQSADVAQVVLHALAPHTYALQDDVAAARQLPAPSQVRAAV